MTENKSDLENGEALGDDLAPPALCDNESKADELVGDEVDPDFDPDEEDE